GSRAATSARWPPRARRAAAASSRADGKVRSRARSGNGGRRLSAQSWRALSRGTTRRSLLWRATGSYGWTEPARPSPTSGGTIRPMLVGDITVLLIPLWILLGLVVLLGILGLLGRIQGGRYLKPLFGVMTKVPFLKRQLENASKAAIERTNPELASAMRKLEPHAKQLGDPQQAQKVMSRLTREERAALLEMQE